MTLIAEFQIPRDRFVLTDSLTALPELRLRILRIAVSSTTVSPLMMVSPGSHTTVDETISSDNSLENVQLLATFENDLLYRTEWNAQAEAESEVFTVANAGVLRASVGSSGWRLTVQFTDHDALNTFLDHLNEDAIEFSLHRLGEMEVPPTGLQYGLTSKQNETLLTAWRMGYFESPRGVSLDTIAATLGISQQAVSQRLTRGQEALIGRTLGTHSVNELE